MIVVLSLMTNQIVFAQEDWADPNDGVEYPILDIGYYPYVEGQGNCHTCLHISRKSLYATENPDCRVVPFANS